MGKNNTNVSFKMYEICSQNYTIDKIQKIIEVLMDVLLTQSLFPFPTEERINKFPDYLIGVFEKYFSPIFCGYFIDDLNGPFVLIENMTSIIEKTGIFISDLIIFISNFQIIDQKKWFFKELSPLPENFFGQLIYKIYLKWIYIFLLQEKKLYIEELEQEIKEAEIEHQIYFLNLFDINKINKTDARITKFKAEEKPWDIRNEYICYYSFKYLMKNKIIIIGSNITKNNSTVFGNYLNQLDKVDDILNTNNIGSRPIS
jgi:hypothetical protein